jgi:hypothetical protein
MTRAQFTGGNKTGADSTAGIWGVSVSTICGDDVD